MWSETGDVAESVDARRRSGFSEPPTGLLVMIAGHPDDGGGGSEGDEVPWCWLFVEIDGACLGLLGDDGEEGDARGSARARPGGR